MRTIASVLLELRRILSHDRWTPEQLQHHQQRSLAVLREFARSHSTFYRSFHRQYSNAPLEDLPILTKTLLMDNFDALVTDPRVRLDDVRNHLTRGFAARFRGRYEVVATSGTTGTPGIFLFDPSEWTTIIASFARAREWAGLSLSLTKPSRMAVVSSTNDVNLSARVARAADTPLVPTIRIDATAPVDEIVAKLNSWQPDSLVAYASLAYLLAVQQQDGRLRISPRNVFTSSEVLTHPMRQTIGDAWGSGVFNEYASTETAMIAAEDTRHHGMHVFEDLLIVENVDGKNQPVPPGEFGDKLLITTLFSRTQPLIRYELSDSVRVAREQPLCSLPYSVIDGIQGRREDTIVLLGRGGESVPVHPNLFHGVMDVASSRGWQVVQERDRLRILLVDPGKPAIVSSLRMTIAEALTKLGVTAPPIEVDVVTAIPRERNGKSVLIKAFRNPATVDEKIGSLSGEAHEK